MNTLTGPELAYLAAWAREERIQDCWAQPAHRLQAAHKVRGISFIQMIKAWTRATGKRDHEIYAVSTEQAPSWPWSGTEAFAKRLDEVTSLTDLPNGAAAHPASGDLQRSEQQ